MSELKPCPFCGGKANCSKHFVFCTVCHAESDWLGDDGAAIAAWNRRAPGWEAGAEAMREAAACNIDCVCECRDAVLAAKRDAERWRACGCDPCGALEAAAIRALPLQEPPK
jgi:hypothetical protein